MIPASANPADQKTLPKDVKERVEQKQRWVENGSDDLKEAWVSICAAATTHTVQDFKLTEVIEAIRQGRIAIWDDRKGAVDFDLAAHQAQVHQLYAQGIAEADALNRRTQMKIVDALGLDVAQEAVTLIYTQPKGNEKKFVVTGIKLNGERRDAPPGYAYIKPEVLGKKKADEAKKRTPAVLFAGFFKPERNSDYLLRATGLYPLDFDAVDDLDVVLDLVCGDKHVAFVFISISGSGLRVCVRGPTANTASEYSTQYERIAALKSKEWGLETKVDLPTKDCSRLAFLAYDPDLYCNWDARALTVEDLPKVERKQEAQPTGSTSKDKALPNTKAGTKSQGPKSAAGLPLEIDWGEIPASKWEDITLGRCLDAMRYIDPCCGRDTWRTVGGALKLGFGGEAFAFFDLWSSQGGAAYSGTEDCRKMWDGHKREEGTLTKPPTILWLAKQNGFKASGHFPGAGPSQAESSGAQPSPLPTMNVSGGRDWNLIAADAVARITGSDVQTVFLRDDCGKHMVEVISTPTGDAHDNKPKLSDVRPVEFASLLSRFAALCRVTPKGDVVAANIEQKVAALIMAAAPMRNLPIIRTLSSAPVLLLCKDGNLRVIGPGYDGHTGIYVTGNIEVTPTQDWKKGRDRLLGLACDYGFPSDGDLARFIASVLTPSLVVGQFLRGERAPLTVFEADGSQTGKGYATKLIGSVYGESPQRVVQKTGDGLGSLQNSFDSALLRGRPFISFDNMRDRLDLPCLESFATEDVYPARGFRKDYIEVDPSHYVIFMTSNGVSVTPDIVKRFNLIRFQKQPPGYRFWRDTQGRRLLPHVRDCQPLYLGAVWSVLTEWHRRGMPATDEARHDFWAWSQSLDWIVRNLFDLPPLLEGFEEIQRRMVSEYQSFARQLCLAVKATEGLGKEIRAAEFAGMCLDRNVKIPGLRSTAEDADAKQIGNIMKRLFKDTKDDTRADIDDDVGKEQALKIEGFSITRIGEWSLSRNRSYYYVVAQET